jgi:hypothetical protein
MPMGEFTPTDRKAVFAQLDQLVLTMRSLTGVQSGSKIYLISVQPLCSLCLCGCFFEQFLTTEAQRTQRLHREEVRKRLFEQSQFKRLSQDVVTNRGVT